MRINFLGTFLEDFRSPGILKIMSSKSGGNHGTLWAKSTNFQGLWPALKNGTEKQFDVQVASSLCI